MHKYQDILNDSKPNLKIFKLMDLYNRAAQFAPFAALNGHADAIYEAGVIYDDRIKLSNDEELVINDTLIKLKGSLSTLVEVELTYFNEFHNNVGSYITKIVMVKKIMEDIGIIVLNSNEKIIIKDIIKIKIRV